MKKAFPIIRQLDVMDCGPTCLKMIAQYFGKSFSLGKLRNLCEKGQQGVTLLGINRAAENLGFKTLPARLTTELFIKQAKLPCLAHWKGDHYVVVYKIKKNIVYIADPSVGKLRLTIPEFQEFWSPNNSQGIALFIEPTEKFYQSQHETPQTNNGINRLFSHLLRFKHFLGQLGLGALIGSLLNLIFPFLTQALVLSLIPI